MSSKYQTRVFTRGEPCNKSHLWNCFAIRGGKFRPVSLDEARSLIGENVPRVIRKAGRATAVNLKGGQRGIVLTKRGEKWLRDGVLSFIRNNPDEVPTLNNVTQKLVREATA